MSSTDTTNAKLGLADAQALLTPERARLALDAIDPTRCGEAARCDVALGLYSCFREKAHFAWKIWATGHTKRYAPADAALWDLARSVHAAT